mmetsp:Transcript_87317/g.138538  ORF Transcript_87317/g.138538 Transcript_87317/m.138538 type:complete len:201 (+) Transcript_87317:759-1361(+)
MCFSTLGFTRQNQQSAWGSTTIWISLFFFLGPPSLFFGRLMEMVIILPPQSSIPSRSQAASASSGVEKVTQPKPLQGLPSPASLAKCTRSIFPTCFSAAWIRFSSMFAGKRPRKTVSGSMGSSSGSSIAEASRFVLSRSLGAVTVTKGFGVVLAGRCFSTVSGMVAAGLSERPWNAERALPLEATLPRAMHRQTWPPSFV